MLGKKPPNHNFALADKLHKKTSKAVLPRDRKQDSTSFLLGHWQDKVG